MLFSIVYAELFTEHFIYHSKKLSFYENISQNKVLWQKQSEPKLKHLQHQRKYKAERACGNKRMAQNIVA